MSSGNKFSVLRAAREQAQEHCEVRQRRDELLDPGHGDEDARQGDAHAPVALGLHHHQRPGLGDREVGAERVATGLAAGTLPPSIGIRIKPFTPELSARSFRTLELFLSRLLEDAGKLPGNFVVTLAKVTSREQVSALAGLLSHIERQAGIAGAPTRRR